MVALSGAVFDRQTSDASRYAQPDTLCDAFGIIRKSILKIGIHGQRRRRGDLAKVFEHDRARNELRVVGQSFTESESGRRGRDRLKSEMLEIDRRPNVPGVRQHETS